MVAVPHHSFLLSLHGIIAQNASSSIFQERLVCSSPSGSGNLVADFRRSEKARPSEINATREPPLLLKDCNPISLQSHIQGQKEGEMPPQSAINPIPLQSHVQGQEEEDMHPQSAMPHGPSIPAASSPQNIGAAEHPSLDSLKVSLAQGALRDAVDCLEHLAVQVHPDVYALILRRCGQAKTLLLGERVHNHIVKNGYQEDTFLANNLIDMYRHCRALQEAVQVFENLEKKNVFSWTIMISTYADCAHYAEALRLFKKMQDQEGLQPDPVTISIVLGVCCSLLALDYGRAIHHMLVSQALESNIVVETALVSMYAKCGSLEEAQKVFESMKYWDVVSWTALITGYAQQERGKEAIQLFQQMQMTGLKPVIFTFLGALSACATIRDPKVAEKVHASVIQSGMSSRLPVSNALVHMYSKCGNLGGAMKVFLSMHERDVISWTAMLEAYDEHGRTKDTLQLFKEMQREGTIPVKFTFLSILHACGDLAALEQGKQVHAALMVRQFHMDAVVGTALVQMYGRCGSVESALEAFIDIREKDVLSWTTMIEVYAQHGYEWQALLFFENMMLEQVDPSELTFVSVLQACGRAGLVQECWYYFRSTTKDYGLLLTSEHYACMVKLLGRAGTLEEAESFISKMPLEADIMVWQSMLNACICHCDIERCKQAAAKCIQSEPGYGAPYVLLANIYAAEQRWEEAAQIRKLMTENGIKQQPGKSSIEIKDKIHEFVAGDRSHQEAEAVYGELDRLNEHIGVVGHVPESRVSLHDVEEELNEELRNYHSERLAIAFGNLMTEPSTTLCIVKNLRTCYYCHAAIKLMSLRLDREIIVRDSCCFHHFKQGSCTCKDYW